jgi:hypothetical protein
MGCPFTPEHALRTSTPDELGGELGDELSKLGFKRMQSEWRLYMLRQIRLTVRHTDNQGAMRSRLLSRTANPEMGTMREQAMAQQG